VFRHQRDASDPRAARDFDHTSGHLHGKRGLDRLGVTRDMRGIRSARARLLDPSGTRA
jgi:hypothetical protein